MKNLYSNDWSEKVNPSLVQNFIDHLGIHSGVHPDDYLTFFGMRSYDILMGVLVSNRREGLRNEMMNI